MTTAKRTGRPAFGNPPMSAKDTVTYDVVVGNVGTVYSGPDSREAVRTYLAYVIESRGPHGRAVGEAVTLLRNGEPIREYAGTLD